MYLSSNPDQFGKLRIIHALYISWKIITEQQSSNSFQIFMKSSEQSQTCQTLSRLWSSLKKYHKPKFIFIHPFTQQHKKFDREKKASVSWSHPFLQKPVI